MSGRRNKRQNMVRGNAFAFAVPVLAWAFLWALPARADDIKIAVMTIASGQAAMIGANSPSPAGVLALKPIETAVINAPATKQSWILRQILALKAVSKKWSQKPIETSALGAGPRLEAAAPRMIVAEADPYYNLWQSHANEKLEDENGRTNVKQHPAAAAHPESYVVVCEAGCREATGQIVYMVSKVAAAEGQKAVLETTSSETQGQAIGSATAPKVTGDPNSLPCMAGCYDRPEPRVRREIKKAENTFSQSGSQFGKSVMRPDASLAAASEPAPLPPKANMFKTPTVKRWQKIESDHLAAARYRGWKVNVKRTAVPELTQWRTRVEHFAPDAGRNVRARHQRKFADMVLDALR